MHFTMLISSIAAVAFATLASAASFTDTAPKLPACGHLCFTLSLAETTCPPISTECLCNHSGYLETITDCVLNGGYCTTHEEKTQVFRYALDLCGFPKTEDLATKYNVTATKTLTSWVPKYTPTTFTWEYTFTKTHIEVETTYGPCSINSTSTYSLDSLEDLLYPTFTTVPIMRRQEEDEETITTTTTVMVTVTNYITIDDDFDLSATLEPFPYPSVVSDPPVSSYLNHSTMSVHIPVIGFTSTSSESTSSPTESTSSLLEPTFSPPETISSPSNSTSPASSSVLTASVSESSCLITRTKTMLVPHTTSYFSIQSYTMDSSDTRAPKPTGNYTDDGDDDTSGAMEKFNSESAYIYVSVALVLVALYMQYQ